MQTIYQINGYKDRNHCLRSLAEDNGIELNVVLSLADLLGENEDFDGLVTSLEDYTE